jgi:cytochrome P450
MLIHQEIQTRVQQELDQALAAENGQVPEHNDADKLPYLAAVLKEVLRYKFGIRLSQTS